MNYQEIIRSAQPLMVVHQHANETLSKQSTSIFFVDFEVNSRQPVCRRDIRGQKADPLEEGFLRLFEKLIR